MLNLCLTVEIYTDGKAVNFLKYILYVTFIHGM